MDDELIWEVACDNCMFWHSHLDLAEAKWHSTNHWVETGHLPPIYNTETDEQYVD